MENIAKAYYAEGYIGSYCTAPLRGFNQWFEEKCTSSEGLCGLAWKVCYVVSGFFAGPFLGLLALVGIAINLCLIPPENGYSWWARLNGVPNATEECCQDIRKDLLFACKIGPGMNQGTSNTSAQRWNWYNRGQSITFDIQDIFDDVASVDKASMEVLEEDGRVSDEQQAVDDKETQYFRRSLRMETHILSIQNIVRGLSRKYNWVPEKQYITTLKDWATLVIPVPDHIPMPN